jgi:hypothetical protein
LSIVTIASPRPTTTASSDSPATIALSRSTAQGAWRIPPVSCAQAVPLNRTSRLRPWAARAAKA